MLNQNTSVSMSGVALTAAPPPQLLFNLPAGSKIIRFHIERNTGISGGGVTGVNLTVGTLASPALYLSATALGTSGAAVIARSTIDPNMPVTATDNIGTQDVAVYGTFTATGGNPTAGAVSIIVEYVQREPNGSVA
jgi:hypothetical protein